MKQDNILFKSLVLTPTEFELDVFISDNKELLAKEFSKRYKESVSYCMDELRSNCTYTIYINGQDRIVITLLKLDLSILVHELSHVLHRLNRFCALEFSDEWNAYFLGDLFKKLSDIKQYKKI